MITQIADITAGGLPERHETNQKRGEWKRVYKTRKNKIKMRMRKEANLKMIS